MTWKNRIIGEGDEAPDQLLANPKNARRHPQAQQQALADVLDEVGVVQRVIVNQRTGYVVDGHARIALALRQGQPTIPVVYVDLDEREEALILATLDPISAMATTDAAALDELLRDVHTGSAALQTMLDDLATEAGLYGLGKDDGPPVDAEPQISRADELRAKWGTGAGQLWKLGEHRLAVGDCTDAAVVERVMGGEHAGVCFTSPPYWKQRTYNIGEFDWDALMDGALLNAPMADDGQVFVNLGMVHDAGEWLPYWDDWIDRMRGAGWSRFGWYVWDQGDGMPGDWSGRLAPCFEFVFHFNRAAVKPGKVVECKTAGHIPTRTMRGVAGDLRGFTAEGQAVQPFKIPDAIIRIGRLKNHGTDHPATFPPALPLAFLEAWPNGDVFEPFSGAGSTILACEQLGRRCRAIEIDPGYAAVTLERWADATGGTPELIG